MTTIIGTSRVLALIAGAAIALTACSAATPGSAQSAAAPAAAAATSAAPVTIGGATVGGDAFCTQSVKLGQELFTGMDPNGDFKQVLGKAAAAWASLATSAPAEIRPDVAAVAAGITKGISGDVPDPAALTAALEGPMQRLQEWGATHCTVTGA